MQHNEGDDDWRIWSNCPETVDYESSHGGNTVDMNAFDIGYKFIYVHHHDLQTADHRVIGIRVYNDMQAEVD